MKHLSLLIALLIAATALVGCSGGGSQGEDPMQNTQEGGSAPAADAGAAPAPAPAGAPADATSSGVRDVAPNAAGVR